MKVIKVLKWKRYYFYECSNKKWLNIMRGYYLRYQLLV